MVENICAEVLLSSLLWIGGKSKDIDTNNNIHITYENSVFVIPDDYSLSVNDCSNEFLGKKISMNSFIKKIN